MERLPCKTFQNIDTVFWQLFYIACYSQLIFKTMKWISVKEELPKGIWHKLHEHLSEDVLFCNDLAIFVGRWNRDKWWWETDEPAEGNWVDDVTHWMPLPPMP